jgi:hypothetical protein
MFTFESNINKISPKSEIDVQLLINSLEDCAYYYINSNDIKEKQHLIEYFQEAVLFLETNKSKFERSILENKKIFKIIKDRKKTIGDIDQQAIKAISDTAKESVINFSSYIKSHEAFYCVNSMSDAELNNESIFDMFSKNEQKSVKVENIGKYLIYMMSGYANKDYKNNKNPENFKKQCEKRLGLKMDTCHHHGFDAEIKGLDGNNYLLEATSNSNTENQRIQQLIKKSETPGFKTVYLTSGYFYPEYNEEVQYNNRKGRLHGSNFFQNLSGNEISKKEIEDLNLLPFMSMIKKINSKSGMNISDFTKVNPFVVGSDTYDTYRQFRDIQLLKEPEKTEAFLDYCIFYGDRITKTISKLNRENENMRLDEKTKSILENTALFIVGLVNNFNKSNLKNNQPSGKQKNKIIEMARLLHDTSLRFNGDIKMDSLIQELYYDGKELLDSKYKIINRSIGERSKGMGEHIDNEISQTNLNKIKKTIDNNFTDFSSKEREGIFEAIKLRQKTTEITYFIENKKDNVKIINTKKLSKLREKIKSTNDFNTDENLKDFTDFITEEYSSNIYRGERVNDNLLNEMNIQKKFSKNIKECVEIWENKHKKSYKINDKTFLILQELEESNSKIIKKEDLNTPSNYKIFWNIKENKSLNKNNREGFNSFLLESIGLVDLFNKDKNDGITEIDIPLMNSNLENAIENFKINNKNIQKNCSKKNRI